jgi:Ca-activated chloride channel family protein
MNPTKTITSLIIPFLLITTACSPAAEKDAAAPASKPKPEAAPHQQTPPLVNEPALKRKLTPVEQMMMRPPGRYSGKNYDEAKVKAELDKLPQNWTKERYFQAFLDLLAEDYRPEVTTFVNFDPVVRVHNPRPDEKIVLPPEKRLHVAILLDASGSMNGKADGKTKMEAAKGAIRDFVSRLPANADVSLTVYGHKGTGSQKDKSLSCSSVEEVFKGSSREMNRLQSAMAGIRPAGWTPIARALRESEAKIPQGATDAVIYVVSDGIETCGGDPVAEAKRLHASRIRTVVNIIGFDVDNEGQRLLKQVAEAGGGEFAPVSSERSLSQYWRDQYDRLKEEWMAWKERGKKEAIDLKEQKKKLAISTKESIKQKAAVEKEHLKMAHQYLKEKWGYSHPVDGTFSMILERYDQIFDYAVDTGNDLWNQAVSSGNQEWGHFVEEGNRKINEAIDKKYSR